MVNQRVIRRLLRWRKWAKRDWAIAASAAGFAVIIFSLSLIFGSWTKRSSGHHPPDPLWVHLSLSENAKSRGAACLDGSLPGYHFQKGFGSGSNNWVVHIEGGGWCDSIEACSSRKRTPLGSSRYMEDEVKFTGIFSQELLENPDFFNWNKVKIRYCDGASLAGHHESEFKNRTQLFFRGQLIWEALMNDLLSIGLSSARQALLSGCSAGGLATLIHCDNFREILPNNATVKCLADAGFFLNEKDIAGHHTIESFYQDVVSLQGVAKSLDKDCVARMKPSKIKNIFVPIASDPHGNWFKCKLNIRNCDRSQIEVLEGYRNSLLKTLSEFQQNKEGGLFINSCYIHCQTWMAETWHSPSSPRVDNKTIAEAVGDWYFNRNISKHIDCPYPCNPTCYNMDFTGHR
ncbi:pectin acetylesterase 5-like isoform X2 [Diospyros lotus]|uniref:pectin acetylesterase 5-like isoform X2 n=1 Tax=Diospyros lotus TaxID=55363 RepID=UPI00225909EA|nr:pectin acetylesterase 5-like isoform X2 [Diospyros lotus]